MSAKFTDENGEEERFKFTYFVLFIQCVAGAVCAEIGKLLKLIQNILFTNSK